MLNQGEEVGEFGFTTVAIFIACYGRGDVGSTGGDVEAEDGIRSPQASPSTVIEDLDDDGAEMESMETASPDGGSSGGRPPA